MSRPPVAACQVSVVPPQSLITAPSNPHWRFKMPFSSESLLQQWIPCHMV